MWKRINRSDRKKHKIIKTKKIGFRMTRNGRLKQTAFEDVEKKVQCYLYVTNEKINGKTILEGRNIILNQ